MDERQTPPHVGARIGSRSLSHYLPLRVLEVHPETPTAALVSVDLTDVTLPTPYVMPGQYLQMRVGDHPPAFFSIASPPADTRRLQFLIRRQGPAAEAILTLQPGEEVWVSPVAGAGFPMGRAEGGDLLLFATGSGIAPIRAVVGHVLGRRARFGRVWLYMGARNEAEVAFASEIEGWERGGINVRLALSQPSTAWTGARGYVQSLLAQDRPELAGVTALVCGVEGMIEAVTAEMEARGVPRDHVFKNF